MGDLRQRVSRFNPIAEMAELLGIVIVGGVAIVAGLGLLAVGFGLAWRIFRWVIG